MNTHLSNAPTLGFFFGFLVFEMARRDWKAVGIMVIMALGFAVFMSAGFSLALFFPQVLFSLGLFIPTRMLYLRPLK